LESLSKPEVELPQAQRYRGIDKKDVAVDGPEILLPDRVLFV
jgi:hypothetical protein